MTRLLAINIRRDVYWRSWLAQTAESLLSLRNFLYVSDLLLAIREVNEVIYCLRDFAGDGDLIPCGLFSNPNDPWLTWAPIPLGSDGGPSFGRATIEFSQRPS